MKVPRKRLVAGLLAMALAICPISEWGVIPVHASESSGVTLTESYSEAGNQNCEVTVNVGSGFTVTIPKKITLSGADGTSPYNVTVEGDIGALETIKVVPDENFNLQSSGKTDVTSTVTQSKTSFDYEDASKKDDSNTRVGTTTQGSVTAQGLSAGNWSGKFNFNISLEETLEENLEAGLYDAEGVMLCTWEESGIDASQDYSYTEGDENYWKTAETSGYSVLTNNYPTATKVVIPSSVTTIGECAFQGCTGLTSVILPDSLTTINRGAFFNCTSLTSVTIPDSVTSIGVDAFARCSSLTSVNIPDGVTTIGNVAFRECSSLTSVMIPDSVTTIGISAFWDCTGLTSVTFETTSGWYVGDSEGEKTTALSESDLADTSTASTYLVTTYYNKFWTRE